MMKGLFLCFSKIAFGKSNCCREVAIVERFKEYMYFGLSEKRLFLGRWLLFRGDC